MTGDLLWLRQSVLSERGPKVKTAVDSECSEEILGYGSAAEDMLVEMFT